jgi:adenosylcobinamide-GDP ribazoletransferase
VSIRSLRAAVSFLTVVPVANPDGSAGERLGRAYFPAIGALVGLVAGLVFVATAALATPLLAAAAAVAALALLTGALHLDGLADSADGLLGRGDLERRLAVMRDPRLGSFGVTTLVVVLVLEVAALSSMSPVRALTGLVIAGALSRLATLAVIAWIPYVRESGLGSIAFEKRRRGVDLLVGGVIAALVCAVDPKRALVAAVLVAISTLAVVALARRRLGGATGDICGATAELGQLAALLAFAATTLK